MQVNNSSFGTKPPAERVFTTEDIASLTGYSKENVRNILRGGGYKPKIRATKISRQAVWTYDAYRYVVDWNKKHIEKRIKKTALKKTNTDKDLEQLKVEHPLVTDFRCFKLSWWPDIEPDCFKEVD